MNCASISKKLLKGDYQFLFEFFNKLILPQLEKRIVASTANLFLMEALYIFDALNLQSHMLDHMHKIVISEKRKYVMGYVYFLTKVFKHLWFPREQVQYVQ